MTGVGWRGFLMMLSNVLLLSLGREYTGVFIFIKLYIYHLHFSDVLYRIVIIDNDTMSLYTSKILKA